MNLRNVDLNLLVLLDVLLQESSVTRAAEKSEMSVSAMSHALSRLREQFGDPLLIRSGRGMVLSTLAEELLPVVREAMQQLELVLLPQETLELETLERNFVLHATDHTLLVLGEGLDALCREEAPGVDLQFLPNRSEDAQLLRDGTIDLAIGVFPQSFNELRTQRLFQDRFVCVVRREHPTIQGELSLEQYLAHDHIQIAPRGKPGGLVDTMLEEMGHERRISRAVPYFLTGLQWAASTDCILTVSERAARKVTEELGLQILTPPLLLPDYSVMQLWHPRFNEHAPHRWLRSVFKRVAEQLPALDALGAMQQTKAL